MVVTPARIRAVLLAALCSMIVLGLGSSASAQGGPTMLDSRLGVRTVVGGLVTPTSIAFLGPNDILVTEKNTGRVQRVVNGAVQGTVLDLAVNFASERGLLGLALHPSFPANPSVYLYWTESTTGADSGVLSETPLLGNRVDRYVWDGATLTFAQNLIRIRAFQADAGRRSAGTTTAARSRSGPTGSSTSSPGTTAGGGTCRTSPADRLPPARDRRSPTTSSEGRRPTTRTAPASSSG
jgi:hypothetical protein